MESVIYYIVPLFIGLGFLIIVVAPAWKLFKKAGERPWRSLIPGVNAFTFIKTCSRRISYAGFLSLLAFAAYWLAVEGIGMTDESGVITGDIVWLIALTAFVLVVSTYFFAYPYLSVLMLVSVTFFLTDSGIVLEGLPLVLTAVLFGLAAVQFVSDALSWTGLLKKLGRPLWHAAFLFLAFPAAAALAVTGLFIAPLSIEVLLAVMVPALFIGFSYYYYLGFSAKVRLSRE